MADTQPREYELVYILQPDVNEDGILALNERLGDAISDADGTVVNTELWGKRLLAYPIKKHFEGHYVLHRLEMEPEGTAMVDRLLRFNEDVIRYMILRADEL